MAMFYSRKTGCSSPKFSVRGCRILVAYRILRIVLYGILSYCMYRIVLYLRALIIISKLCFVTTILSWLLPQGPPAESW